MVFKLGKCYEHTTGKRMHIVAQAELDIYISPCFIAETDTGEIIPVGITEEHAVNWQEITREKWLNTFKSSYYEQALKQMGE